MLPFLNFRTFKIKGPFGLQFGLKSPVSDPQSSKYSQDEPAAETPLPMDVSEPSESNPLSRTPSLAPTECIPDPPTQEEIVAKIQTQGIKVRDFAYEKQPDWYKPIPEFFDPDKALGEHDYRLSNRPRREPISGKVSRRLLDIGWVSTSDAKRLWHPMDWEALAVHDSRPHYPWKARKVTFPNKEQRDNLRVSVGQYLEAVKRAFLHLAAAAAAAAKAQEEANMIPPEPERDPFPHRATQPPLPRGEKRPFAHDDDDDDGNGNNGDVGATTREGRMSPSDAKKRRLKGDVSMRAASPAPLIALVPPKQYPAPRAAYSSTVRPLIPESAMPMPSPSGSCAAEASAPLMSSGSMPSSSQPIRRRKGLQRMGTVSNII